jgi:hypothetical protein
MTIQVEKKLGQDFAEIVCHGQYSTSGLLKALDEGLDFAAANGLRALLMDVFSITGAPDTMDRFELGSKGAELQISKPSLVTIAFVGKQPQIDAERFGETVAVNRCADVKVFEDRDEAIRWLARTSS